MLRPVRVPFERSEAAGVAGLAAASGLPLHIFRAEHVQERIRRALAAEEVEDVTALARLLRQDGHARARFRRTVAVSHSGFFRDSEQFEALEQRVLPRLLERRETLRVWSAGCANGLELWSMAVVLNRLGVLDRAELLGSDLLEENLAVARAGHYDVVDVSPSLRGRPRWERRDIVTEPAPAGAWDCILCRNVAIYLEPAAKAALHRRLAGALSPGGIVVLGRSERLAEPSVFGLRRAEPHVYERTA
jgi:chemotaxis protein methyltransferase CheR